MSKRVVNAGFAFGALILVVFLASKILTAEPVASEVGSVGALPTTPPTPSARADLVARDARIGNEEPLRTYAVKVVDLQGLAPDAAPGTVLDLWVAWDPPVTPEPRFQLLLPRLTLERIVPPVTPEGPATALLQVERSAVADLLYGDRYGSFSVTIVEPGPQP